MSQTVDEYKPSKSNFKMAQLNDKNKKLSQQVEILRLQQAKKA